MARLIEKGIASFRLNLRAAVRALWSGVWDDAEFIAAVGDDIERAYPQAWLEGASACGIKSLDELTEEEQDALKEAIFAALPYIGPFADAIVAGSRANKGKLAPLLTRTDIWVNQYNGILAKARTMSCGDLKWRWVRGPTEVSCRDCSAYNGRVYRGSTWAKYGIYPKSPSLACHGFNCLCKLEATDAPITRGRPPAMTG